MRPAIIVLPINQSIFIGSFGCSAKQKSTDPKILPYYPVKKSSQKFLAIIPYVKTEIPRLACATCNKVLAPKSSILPYGNDDVDDYYLAQPMDWMSPEFDNREHEGYLACTECENVVGEYNWNGRRNLKGQWITPAFVLLKNAVVKTGWK